MALISVIHSNMMTAEACNVLDYTDAKKEMHDGLEKITAVVAQNGRAKGR